MKVKHCFLFNTKPTVFSMKKTAFVFMTVLAGLLAACQPTDLSPSELASAQFLNASAARLSVEADPVTQSQCKGKLSQVPLADLPAAVTSYLSTNYTGATVLFAGKDAEGKLVVAVQKADGTHVGVLFKADGSFAQELQRHAKKAKLAPVEVSALAGSITSYISSTYSGAEIKRAGKTEDGSVLVHLKTGDTHKVLLFNADGTFARELEKPMGGLMKKKRHGMFG
jgi:hypothetical protein